MLSPKAGFSYSWGYKITKIHAEYHAILLSIWTVIRVNKFVCFS